MNFDSISSIVIDDKIKLSDMNNQNSIRKKDFSTQIFSDTLFKINDNIELIQ